MIDELKQWEYDRGYAKGKMVVLDKIRAEIELEKFGYPPSAGYYKAIMKCLQYHPKNLEGIT